jgi:hypothetical protein
MLLKAFLFRSTPFSFPTPLVVNPFLDIACTVDIPIGVQEYVLGIDESTVKANGVHAGLLKGQGRPMMLGWMGREERH